MYVEDQILFEIGPVLYLPDLKKNLLALEDRLTRK